MHIDIDKLFQDLESYYYDSESEDKEEQLITKLRNKYEKKKEESENE